MCFLRSDRESSEVTSNPDPTRGLGALRPRSDAAQSPGLSSSSFPTQINFLSGDPRLIADPLPVCCLASLGLTRSEVIRGCCPFPTAWLFLAPHCLLVGVQCEAQLPQSLRHLALHPSFYVADLGADFRAHDRLVGGEHMVRTLVEDPPLSKSSWVAGATDSSPPSIEG